MPVRSVEKSVRSRLLPQLSFRRGLLGVTVAVVLAWMGRLAMQEVLFAQVVLMTLASLLALQLFWTLLFLLAWIPASAGKYQRDDLREGNPFAADQLPPQILPPKGQ
jgi:hypothetical protein